jgi:hypothetical protein
MVVTIPKKAKKMVHKGPTPPLPLVTVEVLSLTFNVVSTYNMFE